MKFFFRKPVFPILVDTGTELIVLRKGSEGDRLTRMLEPGAGPLDVIDSRVEGFTCYPKHDILSPLTLKKDWRKAEIIALYNARKPAGAPPLRAQPGEPQARAGVRGRGRPGAPHTGRPEHAVTSR